jgi:hypothetical protein
VEEKSSGVERVLIGMNFALRNDAPEQPTARDYIRWACGGWLPVNVVQGTFDERIARMKPHERVAVTLVGAETWEREAIDWQQRDDIVVIPPSPKVIEETEADYIGQVGQKVLLSNEVGRCMCVVVYRWWETVIMPFTKIYPWVEGPYDMSRPVTGERRGLIAGPVPVDAQHP